MNTNKHIVNIKNTFGYNVVALFEDDKEKVINKDNLYDLIEIYRGKTVQILFVHTGEETYPAVEINCIHKQAGLDVRAEYYLNDCVTIPIIDTSAHGLMRWILKAAELKPLQDPFELRFSDENTL